jgi:hypothetical protein
MEGNLDPTHQLGLLLSQLADVAVHRFVGTAEGHHLDLQILKDPRRRQTVGHLRLDERIVILKEALSPTFPGGRKGVSLPAPVVETWVSLRRRFPRSASRRSVSSNARPRFHRPHMLPDCVAADAQFLGNSANFRKR